MKQTGIYTIEEIKNKLTPIFEERGVIKAVLFGSYAKGEATEDSDVDIAVRVNEEVGGFEFYGIGGSVAEVLNRQVDFIDLEDVIPQGKAALEIKNTGVVIFEKIR
ncbi:MAG: nucleotidyltransferase domain-containing protein [Defluviitaleaceae bacterium]|nr:nucleotidyltransferase domain-containing protein [Defluviitaleaceae bacterium]